MKDLVGRQVIVLACVFASGLWVRAERLNFDWDWEFAMKDFNRSYGKIGLSRPQGHSRDNGQPRVLADTNGWTKVRLPHDWAFTLPLVAQGSRNGFHAVGSGFPQNNVGWYRKWFSVPKSAEDGHVFLHFDGVYRDSQYWVNGVYLGRNDSGFIGRRFDVTDFVHYGSTNNFVTVRVNAESDEGWWYMGAGIYRHAWMILEPRDGLMPDSVFIYLKQLKPDKAVMHVDYETFVGGKGGEDFIVPNPHLWSPEDPYLYKLKLKGQVFTYGIRTVKFDPDRGLLLNGKHLPVKGVCVHDNHAGVGVTMPDALETYRVKLLKGMGANALRTSHNPPSPALLDACDRLGMIVMDEQRFFSSSEEGLDQFRRFVLRDRNHPSVVAWSLGNEEDNDYMQNGEFGRRIAERMKTLLRTVDPTRVCTYAGNNAGVHHGINEAVDVRGVNYVRTMGGKVIARMGAGIDSYHAQHPELPIWGSEEASTFATRGCEKGEEVWFPHVSQDSDTEKNRTFGWALTAEEWTTCFAERPYLAGAFAWNGFDYQGECPWPSVANNFGIFDQCGFEKNNVSYYRARWSERDVLRVYPHWNLPRTNLWVNTNCDSVELFVNGKLVGSQKRDPKRFRLSFPVTYAPGTVLAKGVRNGRVVEFRMETTGPVTALKVEADRTELSADGEDVTVVNVSALDEKGREVPTACDSVSFTLAGEGEIVGVGNGDPMSHEKDVCAPGAWTRKLFNGKCQVIVRSLRRPGMFTLSAKLANGATSCVEVTTVGK